LQTADGMASGVQGHANSVPAAYRLECMSSCWRLNSYEMDGMHQMRQTKVRPRHTQAKCASH